MSFFEGKIDKSVENHFKNLCFQEESVVAVVAFLDPLAKVFEFGSKAKMKGFSSDSDADLMIFFSKDMFINDHFSLKRRLKQELNQRRAGPQVDEIVFDPESLADLAFWSKILCRGESHLLYKNGRFLFPWRQKGFIPELPAIVDTVGEW